MRVVTHTGTHTAMETVGVRACHGVKEIPQGARSRKTGEQRPGSVSEDEVGPVVLGKSAGRSRAPHQVTAVGKQEMQLCNAHKGVMRKVPPAEMPERSSGISKKLGERQTEQLRGLALRVHRRRHSAGWAAIQTIPR